MAGAPKTYTTSAVYNIDGTLQSTSLPAVGALPAETVAARTTASACSPAPTA
ncbi:hypothetical protein ACFWWT_38815 [Streptomyces sp. NPDC058676]|uniref:hypothetical protein n=1 Tax=unclassified Streptomyces TaxID=2593676 RepID=UPI0036474E23